MKHRTIELRGTYRYANRGELDRALAEARRCIDDDEQADLEPDWTRTFVRHGATLSVDTVLPIAADRFLASAVLEALASAALEGIVEARCDGRCIDWFPSRASSIP